MTQLADPATHPRVHIPPQQPVAERWYSEKRLGGLARFATAITILNVLGHLLLGFEQSWATPFVALAAAYGTDLLAELFDALEHGRRPRFAGGMGTLVSFLLPAHISGLAVGMLLFAGENLWAVGFASSVAVASKWVLRVRVPVPQAKVPPTRHFLNPSNFGITASLLLFPSISIAPPYQFTENISGALDWILPLIVICSGSYLNTRATGRVPLILAWLGAFVVQAILRGLLHDTPILAGLAPMSGFAFILFTFYMITDPATSPSRPSAQVAFGCAVAALYAFFMEAHVVFGLFYALTIVTACRGTYLMLATARPPAAAPSAVSALSQ